MTLDQGEIDWQSLDSRNLTLDNQLTKVGQTVSHLTVVTWQVTLTASVVQVFVTLGEGVVFGELSILNVPGRSVPGNYFSLKNPPIDLWYWKHLETSLLRRTEAQSLPDGSPPIGKLHPFIKNVTFEPMESIFLTVCSWRRCKYTITKGERHPQ